MTDSQTPDERVQAALRTINFEWAALKAATTEKAEKAGAELARLTDGLDWLKERGLVLQPFGDGWRVRRAGLDDEVLGFGETPIAAIIYARSQVTP